MSVGVSEEKRTELKVEWKVQPSPGQLLLLFCSVSALSSHNSNLSDDFANSNSALCQNLEATQSIDLHCNFLPGGILRKSSPVLKYNIDTESNGFQYNGTDIISYTSS